MITPVSYILLHMISKFVIVNGLDTIGFFDFMKNFKPTVLDLMNKLIISLKSIHGLSVKVTEMLRLSNYH